MRAVHQRVMRVVHEGHASRTTLADVQLFLWDTCSKRTCCQKSDLIKPVIHNVEKWHHKR